MRFKIPTIASLPNGSTREVVDAADYDEVVAERDALQTKRDRFSRAVDAKLDVLEPSIDRLVAERDALRALVKELAATETPADPIDAANLFLQFAQKARALLEQPK